jgi:hypothetical protein
MIRRILVALQSEVIVVGSKELMGTTGYAGTDIRVKGVMAVGTGTRRTLQKVRRWA